MNIGNKFLYFVFFSVILPVIGGIIVSDVFNNQIVENYILHSAIEIVGCAIAIIIFVILQINNKLAKLFTKNEVFFISLSFAAMGVFNVFHITSPLGNNFIFFHSLSILFGGLFFAFITIFKNNTKFDNRYIFGFAAILIFYCIACLIFPEYVPMMKNDGSFTILAGLLNVIGGLGFVIGCISFISRFTSSKKIAYYALATYCMLFGINGLLFGFSYLWDAMWWWSHLLRLAAYLILIFFFTKAVYQEVARNSFSIKSTKTHIVFSYVVLTTCLAVLAGWHLKINWLIQISPNFAPMQYSTALGLITGALCILFHDHRKLRISLALVMLIFATANILQYLLNINFAIDNIFVDGSYIMQKTSHSGRMSPPTTFCFIILSLILIFDKLPKLRLILMISIVIFYILTLFSYLSFSSDIYSLGSLTGMAIHTATGFFLLTLSCLALFYKNKKNKFEAWSILPILSFAILLLITLFAWKTSKESAEKNNLRYFQDIVSKKERLIYKRFELYQQAVKSGVGLIMASREVSQNEWLKYFEEIDFKNSLPGSNGIGIIDYVKKENIDEYLKNIREMGYGNLKIRPETDFKDKFVIRVIEPVSINKEAVGLDIGFEKNRRNAAQNSIDTGELSLTNVITLVQDEKKQAGFLLLAPFYQKNSNLDTIESRRENFKGFVYSPFIGVKFMNDVTEQIDIIDDKGIDFTVYDGQNKTEDGIIYQREVKSNRKIYNNFNSNSVVSLLNQKWVISWKTNSDFIGITNNKMSYVILIFGLVANLLISWLFYLLGKLYGHSARSLVEKQSMLNNVIQNSIDGLILIDGNGMIKLFNPACENIFGYKEEEVLNKDFKILVPKNYNIYLKNPDQTLKKDIIGSSREMQAKRKNGKFISIELTLTEVTSELNEQGTKMFSGIIRDIEIRKKAEKLLVESELKFRLSMKSSAVGMALVLLNGKLIDVNKALCQIVGYNEKELLKTNFYSISYKKDLDLKNINNMIDNKINHYTEEKKYIKKNGRLVRVLSTTTMIVGKNNKPKYFISQIQNIDEIKKTQMQLTKTNKEIEDFTYIISHDLRSPLINLKGYSSQIEKYINKLKEFVDNDDFKTNKDKKNEIDDIFTKKLPQSIYFIQNSVDRMDEMTKAILKLSTTGKKECSFQKINLNQLIRKSCDIFKHQVMSKNGTIVIQKNLPEITADSEALKQIFNNFIDNAIKYSNIDKDLKINITCQESSSHWIFEVKDNGLGIEKRDYDKIFAVFRRGSSSHGTEGHGMGLNYIKSLIAQHQGEVYFESKHGHGTSFFFTIAKDLEIMSF